MIQQFTFLLFLASNKDINIMFGYLTLCVSYLSFAWSACHACAALRLQDECTNEARGIQCATNRGSLVYNSPFMGYLFVRQPARALVVVLWGAHNMHRLASSTRFFPKRNYVSPLQVLRFTIHMQQLLSLLFFPVSSNITTSSRWDTITPHHKCSLHA